MKLLEILKFELRYRVKRPATYIYFGILFVMCFVAATTDVVSIGGGVGQVKENAPINIATMMIIISIFGCLISSAVMGVAILRDFDHQTESIMFTTPIKKTGLSIWSFSRIFPGTVIHNEWHDVRVYVGRPNALARC